MSKTVHIVAIQLIRYIPILSKSQYTFICVGKRFIDQ